MDVYFQSYVIIDCFIIWNISNHGVMMQKVETKIPVTIETASTTSCTSGRDQTSVEGKMSDRMFLILYPRTWATKVANEMWFTRMKIHISDLPLFPLILLLYPSACIDPQAGALVQKLLSQRDLLVQPGLSFINNSNNINRFDVGHSRVSCTISIENWSRWLLGYPVYYLDYGHWHNSKLIHAHSESSKGSN